VAAFEQAGRYSDRKGMSYLSEAFQAHVLPRVPGAILAVAGEDVVPNRPWVRPLGSIAQGDLPVWLSAADLFVSATVADNLPYTILEAMACGRPVVASAVGGVPEQVVDGETGLLVPPRDRTALGKALADLLLEPGRRDAFGAAARGRAESRFAMPRFIADYESLFGEMVAVRANRR
jgi:glycosyltransferase involved in cell wall biosynthesis